MLSVVIFLVACGLFQNSVQEVMQTIQVCNNQYPASMACTKYQVVNIISAFYGRADGTTCPGGNTGNTNCQQAGATALVEAACNGQSSCKYTPDDSQGDPCPTIAKYLIITYSCEDPWPQVQACQDDPATLLRCEGDQTLRLISVFWGRADSSICPVGDTSDTGCSQSSALTTVDNLCYKQVQCQVTPSTDTFDDPCPSTSKYLNINYYCTGAQRIIACQNSPAVSFSCSGGRIINILSAFWGRSDSVTCATGSTSNTHCAQASATSTVFNACNGKRSCVVKPNVAQFGTDPCPTTSKYLVLDYFCLVIGNAGGAVN